MVTESIYLTENFVGKLFTFGIPWKEKNVPMSYRLAGNTSEGKCYMVDVPERDEIFLYLESKDWGALYHQDEHGFEHWFLDSKGRKIFFYSTHPMSESVTVKKDAVLEMIEQERM